MDYWILSDGSTTQQIDNTETVIFADSTFINHVVSNGNVVATNTEVWEAVVIPDVLADYTEEKRNELDNQLIHSFVVGFDFYHFTKDFWVHGWGNLMPFHYNDGGDFSYHKYNNNKQWNDYSGGLIFGYRFNKHLGCFVEGKYSKYWNREWHDFKLGVNYVIF